MIITRLYCGLGNQMFQYAAGLSLAHHHQTTLKLDVSWFSEGKATAFHERYGLDCFNVTEQFATNQEIDFHRGLMKNVSEDRYSRILSKMGLSRYANLLPLGGQWYMQKGFHFDPDFYQSPQKCLIDGGFQSEKYFSPVANILKKHFSFRYPPTLGVSKLEDEIAQSNAVSVHFRRGDFVANETYKNSISALGLGYYKNAFQMILERVQDPKFYVFSDDIDYARTCGICPKDSVFVDCVEHWHAYDKIRLMSLCKNFIISNSTFAWWGSWLSEAKDKSVIYPDPWFANMPQNDSSDLCPASWLPVTR